MFQELKINEIPPLNNLIKSDIFTNQPDRDTILAEVLGVFTDDIIEKGISIGLLPIDIVKNIQIIRCAMILKKIINPVLSHRNLKYLYCAAIQSKKKICSNILQQYTIKRQHNISIEDIMLCAQYGNQRIFKSIYLNSIC